MDVVGAWLGGSQVVREIGRGALARVFLLSDGTTHRALKVLPAGRADRLTHEIALAHDFEHPHVGRLDALVEVRGLPAATMPLAPGRRLLAFGRSARARERYLDAFDGLLQGLAYLHARGIVHRDVKPENVLVDSAGTARLIDFDLALRMGDRASAPPVAGTLAYLSPEGARGEWATPASDVYAAGVMLYAAVTGEVPFTGTVAEGVATLRATPVPRASSYDASLVDLDAFLARALATRPQDRFADGGEALAAFRRARGAGHVHAALDRMGP